VLSDHGDGVGGRVELTERERDRILRLHGGELLAHPVTLPAMLDDAARRAPDRAFLIERDARRRWRQIGFATAAKRSRRVAAALRALGASETRPVMILSGNGIDHALLMLGAAHAAIPVAPVAAALGLDARDGFARLRAIAGVVRPAVVFARDGAAYADAVRAAAPEAAFVSVGAPPSGVRSFDYALLLAHAPLPDGDVVVDGETVAKLMFGSDPSGESAAVVVTHGMIGAMLQGLAQAWPFLDGHPPVIVDAQPWSGAFGGNVVLGIALRHAGTLHVDDGEPTAEHLARTARLRAEIAPTLAFDLPSGWARWVEHLRADDALRRRWLTRLDRACWSGSTMAPSTCDALRAIGVPLAAIWGSTETAGAACVTGGVDPKFDAVGAPLAGVDLTLLPVGDAYEMRVRGPQVTTGYYWRPDLTAAVFDEDGSLRTGDIVRPVDARAPERGLEYVARLDHRFKLSSGTWVRAAELQAAFLAECSDAADVLATGQGGDQVGLLVYPTPDATLLDRDVLRGQIADAMRRVATGVGADGAPRRALIVDAPPARHPRAAVYVARLQASEPDAEVIVL
jgi:feruloyl-CoA synthase